MSSLNAVMIQLHLPAIMSQGKTENCQPDKCIFGVKGLHTLYLSSTFISAVYCTYCFCGIYDLAIACYNYIHSLS